MHGRPPLQVGSLLSALVCCSADNMLDSVRLVRQLQGAWRWHGTRDEQHRVIPATYSVLGRVVWV